MLAAAFYASRVRAPRLSTRAGRGGPLVLDIIEELVRVAIDLSRVTKLRMWRARRARL